ncbi:MAG: hypothetical protein LUH05_07335 [Candidatus Gastranaerophilales bacterium]|nr:hypothetical protein [Candidatus Gastranaerophilales bacterium]
MYYLFIKDENLNGAGQCRQLTEGVTNIEVTEEIYNKYIEKPNFYIYQNEEIVENPNYEEEIQQAERNRLDILSLTAADVERALYKAFGKDFDDIVELASSIEGIDIKALKIELKANNFYRGNEYISQIGALLGITETKLDEFFETNDYTKLLTETDTE